MENTQNEEKQIVITDEVKGYLLVAAKWCKFIAIVGFVGLGILALFGFFAMLGVPLMQRNNVYAASVLFGLVYIIFAIVYIFPLLYLYRFSVEMKLGVLNNDEGEMTSGFLNLKKLAKFTGILTIVVLGLYALMFIIAVPLMWFKAVPM